MDIIQQLNSFINVSFYSFTGIVRNTKMINDEQRKMIQQEVLEALGSAPELDEIQDNGEMIRFKDPQKPKNNCWLCVYPYTTRLYWTRGNWRLGEDGIWGHASESGESRTWTPEEWREFKQQEQERKDKKEKELQEKLKKLREWFDSLPKYGEYYPEKSYKYYYEEMVKLYRYSGMESDKTFEGPGHSYIAKKGLEYSGKLFEMARVYLDPHSSKFAIAYNTYLVFPIIGESGLLESVQTIDMYKNEKRFAPGFPLAGRFYPLFEINSKRNLIFACEGFATGLSIFGVTNRVTVVCLSCGNLSKGIQGATRYLLNYWKLRETPEKFYKRFIIVADNDESKAGEEGAIQACKELGCSYVLIPEEGMDANDYRRKYGYEKLEEILTF